MTEALILELLLMTGLLIVRHWCRIHAPPTARLDPGLPIRAIAVALAGQLRALLVKKK